jgi:4-hydroxyphenylacetate 3-monooxygenase
MPHQSLLYAGRVHACANLPQMMHITRELCGG